MTFCSASKRSRRRAQALSLLSFNTLWHITQKIWVNHGTVGLFEQNAGAKKILVVVGMSYQFLIDIQRFSIAKLAKSFCDDDLKKNNVKS